MKTCSACKETMPLNDFHNSSKSKDGKQVYCKTCNKDKRKDYYKTAHGKAKNDTSAKRWAVQNRKKVFEYLQSHPCVDCGESNPVVLEFDHRDRSEKSFAIGGRGSYDKGWARLLLEIAKCDVRCANCHRKRTAEQFGWHKLAWLDVDVIE